MIEEYMPFDDDVAIVCNEEGKLMILMKKVDRISMSQVLKDIE
jgi:hypothetical protein